MFMNFINDNVAPQPATVAETIETATTPEATTTNNDTENFGVVGLITLVIAYFVWNFIDEGESIKTQIEPKNIKANFRNLFLIGLGSSIFILLFKVLVGKMLLSKIGFVNKIGTILSPLVIG